MPTYATRPRFRRDYKNLTPANRRLFMDAVAELIVGFRQRRFDPRLRLKRVAGRSGVWEMTWAPDGRATFEYGPEQRPGQPHIIWRRVGTHDIFDEA